MYAIIETGGKQYKVSEGDIVQVERLDASVGDTIEIDRVLMLGGAEAATFGMPYIKNVRVKAEVVSMDRAKKIVVFKKKRRKGYRKRQGHRQEITALKIVQIAS
ncbi:MAG: 50S ribosomal protein L21 [Nitrospirae bacterium CG_4_9_14_3_um_filter_53_35]|nr:MAG: 50S ribosomal protein L21 [Nitrospirae bacterium CG2_30_53_67]PIS38308.1 MAG: 50S ribosomal protein L21 [Nitrospirae bacterium CG08_land_8_20_14_0_20_52_24]PIV84542.1 MAG: 50S ribosomal protein L21 [Nitrospirae bacterium CG17_big_fil_post_rev_8_21_14_2_50_50_9]PIW84836.1 MAG: 50S ribosomal protein L21 [Nitrospirae bacterium CG_4_8_14_3_um_filter_50_41]PJA73269.1 MAG: 50S ribosomal protein L21 [Nitrospirae bacterium CG_4_9_14_3_um_filter_53_35]